MSLRTVRLRPRGAPVEDYEEEVDVAADVENLDAFNEEMAAIFRRWEDAHDGASPDVEFVERDAT